MKRIHLCLTFLSITYTGFCQLTDTAIINNAPPPASTKNDAELHPYHVNYWLSGSIIVVGNVGNILTIDRIKSKPAITDEEIATLNTAPLTGFDRWALDQDPTKKDQWDKTSDNVVTGIILLPGLLAFNRNIRHDWLPLLVMYAEAHAEVATIYNFTFLGPTFQNKYRPMVYYDSLPLSTREDGNNRNSFYSGHVASATLATFMMAKIYCDYHPNIGAKKFLLYTAATIPPLALSYMRVLALKHFPSDNLVGLGVGAVCGIVIPELHKKKDRRTGLGMFTTPEGGAGFTLTWIPEKLTASR